MSDSPLTIAFKEVLNIHNMLNVQIMQVTGWRCWDVFNYMDLNREIQGNGVITKKLTKNNRKLIFVCLVTINVFVIVSKPVNMFVSNIVSSVIKLQQITNVVWLKKNIIITLFFHQTEEEVMVHLLGTIFNGRLIHI